MNKNKIMLIWWSFFIALIAAVYTAIYTLLPINPGLMWTSFIILPIWFSSNATPKDVPGFSICGVIGFVWGIICLKLFGLLSGLGAVLASGLGILIIIFVICLVHIALFAGNKVFGVASLALGSFTICLAVGGTEPVVVCISIVAGVLMSCLMGLTGGLSAKLAGLGKEDEKK
jgi:hypothetical protein